MSNESPQKIETDNQLPKLDVADVRVETQEEFVGEPVKATGAMRVGEADMCHTEAEKYHSWPEASCSQLKSLRDSSLAFYHRHENKQAVQPSTRSLAFGTILHLWAELTADEFWKRAVIAPANLCTAAGVFGAKTKDWIDDLDPEAIALSVADEKQLKFQTQQILKNKAAVKLLDNTVDREFNVRWQWGRHRCRCRVDGATAQSFYDLKTTRVKNILADFGREVDKFGYHLQAAYYGQAALAMHWTDQPMQFICTSTTYPHHCEVVVLPPHVLEEGQRQCKTLLEELDGRREFDEWTPGTYGQVHQLRCPTIRRKGL